ncbi:hypothetical protein QO034_03630 [Sedimentitalea sp. JM2-8]|uniref:PA14 domain-containing protein n=1 Tax=Sedimentitalea xiamensis TaxID=3050037 RepID=A0ABT7FAQ0_9RHOB|nr:hypothetical protein [Sedimentitalea xiamensis]MDK3072191.1 hypothetical protein [Sedimentitalea xiamensis]
MKKSLGMAVAVSALICATSVLAAPLKLTPANPQPGSLKSGLNVSYGYAADKFKSLSLARSIFEATGKPGKPLRGLDYRDNEFGEMALTSTAAWYVTARITGYYYFAAPGDYDIEFFVNDGLDARIGGQQVGYFDGIQGCEGTVVVPVHAPSAGWYDVDIFYYQNAGTACLMMKKGPAGQKRSWVQNSAFGR